MIRELNIEDAGPVVALRAAALVEEPLAFGASPETDFMRTEEAVRDYLAGAPDKLMVGAFDEAGTLVGLAGMVRGRQAKRRHRAGIWGMYVAPGARGEGRAAALLDALITTAIEDGLAWVDLSVSSAAPAARRLYERAGFVVWGHERDALRVGDERTDELHMALELRR